MDSIAQAIVLMNASGKVTVEVELCTNRYEFALWRDEQGKEYYGLEVLLDDDSPVCPGEGYYSSVNYSKDHKEPDFWEKRVEEIINELKKHNTWLKNSGACGKEETDKLLYGLFCLSYAIAEEQEVDPELYKCIDSKQFGTIVVETAFFTPKD